MLWLVQWMRVYANVLIWNECKIFSKKKFKYWAV